MLKQRLWKQSPGVVLLRGNSYEILENSHENTFARDSLLIKLTQTFPSEFCKISKEQFFLQVAS